MAKIIAFTNQKGGVGKTTCCINLASCVAEKGKKVLLIDLDPQSNTTSGLGLSQSDKLSIYDVLTKDAPIDDNVICSTAVKGLDCITSSVSLAGAELELASVFGRESILKIALQPILDQYDFIFIDCPPSLGTLTVNALTACNSIIIPMQCEYYALEGLSQLTRTIQGLKKFLNPTITIEGIILTMYDKRSNLTSQVYDEIKKFFGEKLYDSVIPRNVRLAEAPSYGQPIIIYDKNCKGSKAFKALATEFLQKQ
ncbi:MAG: ParA family protein [Christensenellales bacterium]